VPAPHRAVRGGRVASARPWWPALPSLPACRSRLLARRREERKSPSKKRATISTITRMTPGIMSSSKTPRTSFWTSSFRRTFLDNFRLADNPPGIVASAGNLSAQAIIAPTHGSDLWHETRSLRNPVAAGRGRHGRGVSRTRYALIAPSRSRSCPKLFRATPTVCAGFRLKRAS
jgi:hypothetical protein